jgi:hypothetical protein
MGCEGSACRQSANSPADQQLWLWRIRYGSNRAGRIAVTEHMTGPSASECRPALAAGRRVMPTGHGLWWLLGLDQGGDRWIAWSRHERSPVGLERPGCMAPYGSGAAAPGGALRAIDSLACPRSWRTFGPRRLRRQSELGLAATQRDTAADTADSRSNRSVGDDSTDRAQPDQDVEHDLPRLGRRIGANDGHSAGAKESS